MDPHAILSPDVLPYLVVLACVAMACGTVLVIVPREATRRALLAFADAIGEQTRSAREVRQNLGRLDDRRQEGYAHQIGELTGQVALLRARVTAADERAQVIQGQLKSIVDELEARRRGVSGA